MKFHRLSALLLVTLGTCPFTAFGGAAVTYHGRILDSQGRAVEATSVQFKIQVRSPGAGNCLLLEETRSIDMHDSDGVFVIPIGDGVGTRSGADPGITVEEAFSNNSAITLGGLTCNSGHSYTAAALDSRKLVVTFNDGSGAGDQVLPPMDINYVPFALHSEEAASALKVGSIPASQMMSVASGAATPLSAANFSELLLLVNGTSAAYLKPASVPTCASGQVLKGTGGAFVCVTDASGTDTLAGITCADGKILKRVAGAWSCADESGVGTESDPTVQAYAKVAPGTGLTVSGGAVVADFGTTAGKVAQGNDSRFSDSRAPNGAATGDLSGSYPNPTVKAIRGNNVNASAPADAQVYKWVTGSSEFQPKYVGLADLRKADGSPQIPQCNANANETLIYTSVSDTFTCTAINNLDASKITAGTLSAARLPADTMILTCADGKIAKRVSGAWACADDVGVGAETDPSVAAFAKNAPATGLIVNGSNKIAPDFGTGAGKVVEGNDARLSDTRVASDINGVVSTGILQRTGAGAFSTLGVAAPVTNSAGNIGLAVGAGLTLSSGSLVPDFGTASGKIAQGNDSRFPSSTCASGNYSRWNGSAWVCDADAATDSTKVLKSGDTMTGTLTLPANGLILGTSQLVASSGKVGIGTASPGEMLEINGGIKIGSAMGTADGTIRWTGSDFEGRKAGSWVSMTSSGGGGSVVDYLTLNKLSADPTTSAGNGRLYYKEGIDTQTVLLLHADGAQASTSVVDSSSSGSVATVYGDTHIETSVKKYGTASLAFDGSGDYLTFADNAGLNFEGGDFTVEFQYKYSSCPSLYPHPIGKSDDSWLIYSYCGHQTTHGLMFSSSAAGVSCSILAAGNGQAPFDTNWHHIAYVRSGSTLVGYMDGVQKCSSSLTAAIPHSGTLHMGRSVTYGHYFSGNIDEVRISKAVRWTAGFTSPASAYNNLATSVLFKDENSVVTALGSTGGGSVSDNMGDHTATKNIVLGSNYLSGDGDNEGLRITSTGNIGIGTSTPQSALQVTGYTQIDTVSGAPPSADCDAAAEYGRMKVDPSSTASKLYLCTAAGWTTFTPDGGSPRLQVDATVNTSTADVTPEAYKFPSNAQHVCNASTRGTMFVGRFSGDSDQDGLCTCMNIASNYEWVCFNP